MPSIISDSSKSPTTSVASSWNKNWWKQHMGMFFSSTQGAWMSIVYIYVYMKGFGCSPHDSRPSNPSGTPSRGPRCHGLGEHCLVFYVFRQLTFVSQHANPGSGFCRCALNTCWHCALPSHWRGITLHGLSSRSTRFLDIWFYLLSHWLSPDPGIARYFSILQYILFAGGLAILGLVRAVDFPGRAPHLYCLCSTCISIWSILLRLLHLEFCWAVPRGGSSSSWCRW